MKYLVLFAGVILTLAGCATQTAPPPTSTAAPPIPPIPTPTALSPTPTPVELSIKVTSELANCRFGPGTIYLTLNEIRGGRSLKAVGRNDTSTWWLVEDPINPGGFCWVSTEVTEEPEGMEQLPIIAAPFVTVTHVDLRVEPNRMVVGCDQFPQTVFFEAAITTNGPTLLTWQWEASTGVTSDVGTLIFQEAGTQIINEFYRINAPNDYWVKLIILTPNERVEQVTFPVSCNP
ncbi:MAG: hypothetical protein HXY38_08595 [Chloroflexi bacterium]|nr:hypothetical protein [Chloroflexota bacterium]